MLFLLPLKIYSIRDNFPWDSNSVYKNSFRISFQLLIWKSKNLGLQKTVSFNTECDLYKNNSLCVQNFTKSLTDFRAINVNG